MFCKLKINSCTEKLALVSLFSLDCFFFNSLRLQLRFLMLSSNLSIVSSNSGH